MRILIAILLLSTGLAFSQTVPIDVSIADVSLQDSIEKIDLDLTKIKDDQDQINHCNDIINGLEQDISAKNSDLTQRELAVTSVAAQASPLPAAVDYCNTKPHNCVNWSVNP